MGSGERADRAVQPVRPPWERKRAECGAQQDVWRRGHLGLESGGPGACRPRGSLLGEGVTARHSERRREHVPGLSDVTAQRPRRLQ